jgi:hypothetical protein
MLKVSSYPLCSMHIYLFLFHTYVYASKHIHAHQQSTTTTTTTTTTQDAQVAISLALLKMSKGHQYAVPNYHPTTFKAISSSSSSSSIPDISVPVWDAISSKSQSPSHHQDGSSWFQFKAYKTPSNEPDWLKFGDG